MMNEYSSGTPEINFTRWLMKNGGRANNSDAILYAALMRADSYGLLRLGVIGLDGDSTYITQKGREAIDAYDEEERVNKSLLL